MSRLGRELLAALLLTLMTLAGSVASAAEQPADAHDAHGADTPALSSEYFVEEHGGFHLAYHPAARERVRELVPLLESMRQQLSQALGVSVLEDVEIRVAALPAEVPRLSPGRAAVVPVRGGVSFADRGLIVLSLSQSAHPGADMEATLRHHLARLALKRAAPNAQLPAWFAGAFATSFADDGGLAQLAELELATFSGDPPSLGELHDARPGGRTDALAADFIRFTSEEGARMPALFDGLRSGSSFDQALENAFGSDASTIERAWRRDALRRYGVYPLLVLLAALTLAGLLIRHVRRRSRVRAPSRAVHILRLRSRLRARRQETKLRVPVHVIDHELPRVEHDGGWHTLH